MTTIQRWKAISPKDTEFAQAIAALGLSAEVDVSEHGSVTSMTLVAPNGGKARIAGPYGFEVQRPMGVSE